MRVSSVVRASRRSRTELPANYEGIAVTLAALLLGVEAKFHLARLLQLDIVNHQQYIRLHEQQVPLESFDAQFGRVGSSRVAHDVVQRRCRLRSQYSRPRLDRQRLAALKPLLALAQLSSAVNQQRVMLAGPLLTIPVVAQRATRRHRTGRSGSRRDERGRHPDRTRTPARLCVRGTAHT